MGGLHLHLLICFFLVYLHLSVCGSRKCSTFANKYSCVSVTSDYQFSFLKVHRLDGTVCDKQHYLIQVQRLIGLGIHLLKENKPCLTHIHTPVHKLKIFFGQPMSLSLCSYHSITITPLEVKACGLPDTKTATTALSYISPSLFRFFAVAISIHPGF